MNTINEKLNDLNQLLAGGRLLDAFDKYYHEEVVMQENELPATTGKAANRKREEDFLSNIIDFRLAEPSHIAVAGDVSYVTWRLDYTHKEWGVRNYTQVSVQHWKDGQIIREQFFYGN